MFNDTNERQQLITAPQSAPPATKPARKLRLGAKLSAAIDLMVHEGKRYAEAAEAVGFTVRTMRKALDREHVIRELRRRKEVFRAQASAANIHKLVEIRDTAGNAMAQLGAIKTLEQMDSDESAVRSRGSQAPGFTIVVVQQGERVISHQAHMDAKPLIDQAPVGKADGQRDE